MSEPAQLRQIRSFVRREGRLTRAQQRALETLWPRYGLDQDQGVIDLDACFGRQAPRVMEIGFGNGEALAGLAGSDPERDYIGIEVHRPGVGRLLNRLAAEGIDNVRVFCADAVAVLESQIPAASLDQVHIFFPDPWPKKRHHKRRLIQPDFVALLASRVKPHGRLLLATDWADYAEHMRAVLEADADWVNAEGPWRFSPRPPERPITHFEARGRARGHAVWDLVYRRGAASPVHA